MGERVVRAAIICMCVCENRGHWFIERFVRVWSTSREGTFLIHVMKQGDEEHFREHCSQ